MSHGNISVHGRDFQIGKNACGLVQCKWRLLLPKGQRTRLYFSEFLSEIAGVKCIHNMITITVLSDILTFYCNEIPPGNGEVRIKETEVEIDLVVAPTKWTANSGFILNFEAY